MASLQSAVSADLAAPVLRQPSGPAHRRRPNPLKIQTPDPRYERRWRKGLSHAMRRLRIAKRATQQNVADAIGVDRTEVSYYELCRQLPRAYQLSRLARALGTTIEAMCQEADRFAAR